MPRALLVAFAVLAWLAPAFAQGFPALSGRVVDTADLLPAADERALERELAAHETATGHQVVVATVPSLDGRNVETYANELFREWKLGRAEQNDGVLFLVARDDRKTRIEVGYGLEATLTDIQSGTILRSVVLPEFRENRFARGIVAGTQTILDVLGGAELPPPSRERAAGTADDGLDAIFLLLFVIFFVAPLLFGRRGGRGRRRRRRGGLRGPVFLPGPGMGGGFGGGLGGGFGGGGGSSGGGGASGSW